MLTILDTTTNNLRLATQQLARCRRELRAAELAVMVALIEIDLADSAHGIALGSIIVRRPNGWAAL